MAKAKQFAALPSKVNVAKIKRRKWRERERLSESWANRAIRDLWNFTCGSRCQSPKWIIFMYVFKRLRLCVCKWKMFWRVVFFVCFFLGFCQQTSKQTITQPIINSKSIRLPREIIQPEQNAVNISGKSCRTFIEIAWFQQLVVGDWVSASCCFFPSFFAFYRHSFYPLVRRWPFRCCAEANSVKMKSKIEFEECLKDSPKFR